MGFNLVLKWLNEKLDGSHNRSGRFGKEINLLRLPVFEPRTVQPVGLTVLAELSRLQIALNVINVNASLPIKLPGWRSR
jgi:hypothetical protein